MDEDLMSAGRSKTCRLLVIFIFFYTKIGGAEYRKGKHDLYKSFTIDF